MKIKRVQVLAAAVLSGLLLCAAAQVADPPLTLQQQQQEEQQQQQQGANTAQQVVFSRAEPQANSPTPAAATETVAPRATPSPTSAGPASSAEQQQQQQQQEQQQPQLPQQQVQQAAQQQQHGEASSEPPSQPDSPQQRQEPHQEQQVQQPAPVQQAPLAVQQAPPAVQQTPPAQLAQLAQQSPAVQQPEQQAQPTGKAAVAASAGDAAMSEAAAVPQQAAPAVASTIEDQAILNATAMAGETQIELEEEEEEELQPSAASPVKLDGPVVNVRLTFLDMTQADCEANQQLQNASCAALAEAAGVPATFVERVASPILNNKRKPHMLKSYPASLSPSDDGSHAAGRSLLRRKRAGAADNSHKRLPEERLPAGAPVSPAGPAGQQPQQQGARPPTATDRKAVAYFAVHTSTSTDWSSPQVIRRKLLASAAFFGRDFYATLAKHGIHEQPMVFLSSTLIMYGEQASPWDAPASRFSSNGTVVRKLPPAVYYDYSELTDAGKPAAIVVAEAQPKLIDGYPPTPPRNGPKMIGAMPLWVFVLVLIAILLLVGIAGGIACWRLCNSPSDSVAPAAKSSVEPPTVKLFDNPLAAAGQASGGDGPAKPAATYVLGSHINRVRDAASTIFVKRVHTV